MAGADLAEEFRHRFGPSAEAYHTIVASEAWDVHRPWAEAHRDRYDPVVWQRLNRVHGITPPQRESAGKVLADVRIAWAQYFTEHDFLVLPASPGPALTKADCTLGNRGRIITLTAPASLGGRPVLTLPVNLAGGLTTGLQVVVADASSPVIPWILGLRSGAG